jgi:predicted phosphoribosyltransferase
VDEQAYLDRRDAGRALGRALGSLRGQPDLVVLALPRGGVPVAAEVAAALGAPLDVCVVRKLGVPGHEELAMGAIASGGARFLNEDVIASLGIVHEQIERTVARERAELERRERLYRAGRPPLALAGKTVVLVDDGLATGASMRVAIAAVRARAPARIVVGVPVGAADTVALLRAEADAVVCPRMPFPFSAVGWWYEDFRQTTDDEVSALLARPGAAAA